MQLSIKTTFAIAAGTLLEWYDFSLFAYLAPLFANLFFPKQDAIAALLAIFSVYAAGNFTRILGSLWFGTIGDKKGRQQALIYSISLMALPTILMAITPSYLTIGLTASVLLVSYRLLQGFALGGEYQGNAIYLIERNTQKGLAGSWIVTMVGLGMLLASGMTTLITKPNMPNYAWRLAFLLGGTVGLVALIVRYQLTETQQFKQSLNAHQTKQLLPKVLFEKHLKQFILAIMLAIGAASYNYSLLFLPTYFTFLHPYSLHEAIQVLTISLLIGQFLTPLIGWLSDKKCLWLLQKFLPQRWQDSIDNKLALMLLGSGATLLLAYPIYYLYIHGNLVTIVLANLIIGLLCSLYLAPKNALLAQLFPTHICYTGFGLAHNIGLAIAGIVPFLLAKFVIQHHLLMAPAYYLMCSSFMSIFCLGFLWRNKKLFAD